MEGSNDLLNSLSPSDTNQGPELASSGIFVWVWAIKIGLSVPFEKEG